MLKIEFLTGTTAVLVGLVLGCQNASRAESVTANPRSLKPVSSGGAMKADQPPANQAQSAPAAECADPAWESTTIRDPSGRPEIIVRYPQGWDLAPLAPGRILLSLTGQSFQLIFSALPGGGLTDDDVRALDERSIGEFPLISPWRKLEATSTYRAFTVKRKTPGSDIEIWYYAGPNGLVVVSNETLGAVDPNVLRQCERVVQCLQLRFDSAT